MSDQHGQGVDRCNVCGGEDSEHHLCVAMESVLGATVWVYDDGYARVVPSWTGSDQLAEVAL